MQKSLLAIAFAMLPLAYSCSSDIEEDMQQNLPVDIKADTPADENYFPVEDNSPRLEYNGATALSRLVRKMDPTRALEMGETKITEAQMAEIRDFVDKNLKGETQEETYKNIFEWMGENLQYVNSAQETAYLDPYDVFVYKRCVCQGYANLLKTMCISQGIPAFIANGWLGNIGGHAWNYVQTDGKWRVSDPTNGSDYLMNNVAQYRDWLMPEHTDLNLFEDEQFTYNFELGHLNISGVKVSAPASGVLTIPYSVNGYRITSFSPLSSIGESYTKVYVGSNLETFGQNVNLTVDNMPAVTEINISEKNKTLQSYKGVVYMGNNLNPILVPAGITYLELKPMPVMEKNTVCNLPNVTEIRLADGTKSMEAYAIEACPKLRTVYIPETMKDEDIDPQAIYNCGDSYEIVRVPTGITEVTM